MRPDPGETALEPRQRPAAAGGDSVDATLAGAGDTAAYERLYRRHAGRIHGLATRMMGVDEAEECTQEAFIRAWEKLGSFRGDAAFGTWLYRLGVNTILSMRAKRGRRQDKVTTAEDEVLESFPDRRSSGSHAGMDIEKALRDIPPGARDVFVLHDVEGFQHQEIASMLSINIGTSKSQLHRARMLLRRRLES
jgi:RNA polymerase sigma-70 factor (ECF subfamily)